MDRDMLMRHHWGLGIGHVYSHGQRAATPLAPATTQTASDTVDNTADTDDVHGAVVEHHLEGQDNGEGDELAFDNWVDDWVDEEYSEDELSQPEVDENDELILAMDDMYGSVEHY